MEPGVNPSIRRRASKRTSNHSDRQARILGHYILNTLGQVKKRLQRWEQEAKLCEDEELRKQALASIREKGFHCYGGAVFAVPYPEWEPLLVDLIVAYQTLCDYLDNLCDRANCKDGAAFRQLHESLLDALQPEKACVDYYASFTVKDDHGYIGKLVQACRTCLLQLPSYGFVQQDVLELVQLYIDLQVLKHLEEDVREHALFAWAHEHLPAYPSIQWQEFSAATGSTLAVFAFFGLATRSDLESGAARQMLDAFFPWVCGLHILLDYFIDQQEDRVGGDLNFTFFYKNTDEMMERLKLFIGRAHHECANFTNPIFLKTVVEGLLAMYLSDQKIRQQGYEKMAHELMRVSGRSAMRCYQICSVVRRAL